LAEISQPFFIPQAAKADAHIFIFPQPSVGEIGGVFSFRVDLPTLGRHATEVKSALKFLSLFMAFISL
jgi:hypothetical protein